MDLNTAKINMITQQLRTCGVLDERILRAFHAIPRENFVPQAYAELAYADTNLPLDHQQRMMQPSLEAKILQAVQVQASDKILEIGTGSGFLTALLAHLGQHIYSIDLYEDFIQHAQEKLANLNIHNVSFHRGNAAQGWEKQAPYDVIVITGSLNFLPESFKKQLKPHGRLFVIINTAPAMHAHLITRLDEDKWKDEILFETNIPLLSPDLSKETFIF